MSDQPQADNPRRKWLEEIIGAVKARTLRADLGLAKTALDEAGIARKEVPPAEMQQVQDTDTPATPEDVDLQKIARALAQHVMTSLGSKLGDVTEDDMVAALFSGMGMPPEQTVEPTNEEEPVQKATDSMTCPMCGKMAMKQENGEYKCDNCGWSGSKALHMEERKAYADTLASMTKDMSDIAKSVIAANEQNAHTAQTYAEAQKGILEAVNALVKRMDGIEEKVNGKPRSATQAAETVIDPTSEAARAIQGAADKGINGNGQTFMGVAVKQQPK